MLSTLKTQVVKIVTLQLFKHVDILASVHSLTRYTLRGKINFTSLCAPCWNRKSCKRILLLYQYTDVAHSPAVVPTNAAVLVQYISKYHWARKWRPHQLVSLPSYSTYRRQERSARVPVTAERFNAPSPVMCVQQCRYPPPTVRRAGITRWHCQLRLYSENVLIK